jgi:hypothetical protein
MDDCRFYHYGSEFVMMWKVAERWHWSSCRSPGRHALDRDWHPGLLADDYVKAANFSPLHWLWLQCAECGGPSFLDYLCPRCRDGA